MHPKVESDLKLCVQPFRVYRHAELGVPINTPQDFACAIGYPVERICKCLFLRCSEPERFARALCSCTKTVNIALIARKLQCADIRIATPKDLQKHIGYPTKGVSPLGVTGYPLFVDADVLNHATILIGAGVVGEEIELFPDDLIAITKATVLPLGIPLESKI